MHENSRCRAVAAGEELFGVDVMVGGCWWQWGGVWWPVEVLQHRATAALPWSNFT